MNPALFEEGLPLNFKFKRDFGAVQVDLAFEPAF